MRRAEIGTALVLLAIAGMVMYQAVGLGPGWGEAGPRAGFFPFWLSVLLGVSSLYILASALRQPTGPERTPFFPPGSLRLVLTVFLPIAGAFALVELVAIYIDALVYLLVYIRLTGRQSWLTTLLISALFPILSFLVFERWFLLPLPKGLFGDRLLPF